MSIHQDLNAPSEKAEIFRQPPHALFGDNKNSIVASPEAGMMQQMLAAAAGNLKNIDAGNMFRAAHNGTNEDLTPEERKEKEERQKTARIITTINLADVEHSIFMQGAADFGNSLVFDLEALDREIADLRAKKVQIQQEIVTQEENLVVARQEQVAAQENLTTAKRDEQIANTDAAIHEAQAKSISKGNTVVGKDGMTYTVVELPGGEVSYEYTDELGRTHTAANPEILTPDEFRKKGEEIANAVAETTTAVVQAEIVVEAKTATVSAIEAIINDLRNQDAQLDALITNKENERLTKGQKFEEFKKDFASIGQPDGMTQAQFLEKYPQSAKFIEQRAAYEADLAAVNQGDMSQEQLQSENKEYLARLESRAEFKKDKESFTKGEMKEEDYRAKYPRAGARLDEEKTYNSMKETSSTIENQIARLSSQETADRLAAGQTLDDIVQEYGIDANYYNDFSDRHSDLGLKRIEVAEAAPVQSSWFSQIQQWMNPAAAQQPEAIQVAENKTAEIKVADAAPTAKALSSSDGLGIKETDVKLKESFSGATTPSETATPAATPEVVVAAANTYVRPTSTGLGLG